MEFSSVEAEYIALSLVGYQALWLYKVLEKIGERKYGPTLIFFYNTNAIH